MGRSPAWSCFLNEILSQLFVNLLENSLETMVRQWPHSRFHACLTNGCCQAIDVSMDLSKPIMHMAGTTELGKMGTDIESRYKGCGSRRGRAQE